jgi:hypothetical protein
LAAPAAHVAIVVAFDGDEVDRAVKAHPDGLTAIGRFWSDDQPPATVYVSGTLSAPSSMASLTEQPVVVLASGKATP